MARHVGIVPWVFMKVLGRGGGEGGISLTCQLGSGGIGLWCLPFPRALVRMSESHYESNMTASVLMVARLVWVICKLVQCHVLYSYIWRSQLPKKANLAKHLAKIS